jgi:hypothetical protein
MDDPARGAAPPPMAAAGSEPASVSARKKRKISIPGIVIALAMLGSIAFIGYVVLRVEDGQIPMMAAGFVALGASLAAVAAWSVLGIWRSSSRARGGRAFGLAILGGLAGLGAIGCFAVAALTTLVLNT